MSQSNRIIEADKLNKWFNRAMKRKSLIGPAQVVNIINGVVWLKPALP